MVPIAPLKFPGNCYLRFLLKSSSRQLNSSKRMAINWFQFGKYKYQNSDHQNSATYEANHVSGQAHLGEEFRTLA